MSQTLIDALNALEGQIEALAARIKTVDPDKVGEKAAEAASQGVAAAVSGLWDTSRSLQETARGLKDAARMLRKHALPAAERARNAEQRRRWWKPALVVLAVLVALLSGFTGGVAVTRMGLPINTEVGCRYFGGKWTEILTTKDGHNYTSVHGCTTATSPKALQPDKQ